MGPIGPVGPVAPVGPVGPTQQLLGWQPQPQPHLDPQLLQLLQPVPGMR